MARHELYIVGDVADEELGQVKFSYTRRAQPAREGKMSNK